MHIEPWIVIFKSRIRGMLDTVFQGPALAHFPIKAKTTRKVNMAADVEVSKRIL